MRLVDRCVDEDQLILWKFKRVSEFSKNYLKALIIRVVRIVINLEKKAVEDRASASSSEFVNSDSEKGGQSN